MSGVAGARKRPQSGPERAGARHEARRRAWGCESFSPHRSDVSSDSSAGVSRRKACSSRSALMRPCQSFASPARPAGRTHSVNRTAGHLARPTRARSAPHAKHDDALPAASAAASGERHAPRRSASESKRPTSKCSGTPRGLPRKLRVRSSSAMPHRPGPGSGRSVWLRVGRRIVRPGKRSSLSKCRTLPCAVHAAGTESQAAGCRRRCHAAPRLRRRGAERARRLAAAPRAAATRAARARRSRPVRHRHVNTCRAAER